MAIMASKGSSFETCPAGSFAAVCCDVIDLGIVKSDYQGKVKSQHKVWIVWQIDEQNSSGKPFMPRKRYTVSLHEKAALRKDLESWRGRPFTDEELQGFDLEKLIGVGAMISVVQAAVKGNVYANVTAVMRPPKGLNPPAIDPSYVRVQDRPKESADTGDTAAEPPSQDDAAQWEATLDDVPF